MVLGCFCTFTACPHGRIFVFPIATHASADNSATIDPDGFDPIPKKVSSPDPRKRPWRFAERSVHRATSPLLRPSFLRTRARSMEAR